MTFKHLSIVSKKSTGEIFLLTDSGLKGPYVSKQAAQAARARFSKAEFMETCGLTKGKDSTGRTIWE